MEVLALLLESIVQDGPLARAAQTINERGFRTRDGNAWTPPALFGLLPRLIDVGQRLSKRETWAERRRRLLRAV